MQTPPEAFRTKLEKLIAKFEADKDHYLSKGYPEAQARVVCQEVPWHEFD